jgi:hypothetical protein
MAGSLVRKTTGNHEYREFKLKAAKSCKAAAGSERYNHPVVSHLRLYFIPAPQNLLAEMRQYNPLRAETL